MKAERQKIPVGISTCLLGEKVRFDGGHKEDRYLTQTLSRYVRWVPVCPEVEMGLPVPREIIRLVKKGDAVRQIGGRSGRDYTERMRAWARERLQALQSMGMCGYILKRGSPTCGMERVRVYNDSGMPERSGTGLYARMLMQAFPLLPVEEEGRLHDPQLLENFVERLFAYHRLRGMMASNPGPGDLVRFHTAHKLTLMAHSPVNYRRLGQVVSRAGAEPMGSLLVGYAELFMRALRLKATPKKHANVLYHVMGYFKKLLDEGDKTECLGTIEHYRQGYLPLIVPVTLIKHHLQRHRVQWLQKQVYFNPYPEELMLRNKI